MPEGTLGGLGTEGQSIETPGAYADGKPIGGPSSRFNIAGAPIGVLGGVFSAGLPLGGPVTQIFRGGSAPEPNVLFIDTLTSSGPIAAPFIGSVGGPIGERTIGGGGLPIAPPAAVAAAIEAIQPRTALFEEVAVSFGTGEAAGPVPPIGLNEGSIG